jgi:hypothetical protein
MAKPILLNQGGNMKLRHQDGFEKEEYYHQVFAQALCDCPVLRIKTFRRIVARFAPEFMDGIFTNKPCVRKLKFIGSYDSEDVAARGNAPEEFFKLGEIYKSITFNGATYTIKGYMKGSGRIGYVYFDRIT